MVPNHLFQLLTLTAMEPPISFEADAVARQTSRNPARHSNATPEEVLQNMVRGQYGEGLIDGQNVSAYRGEPNVSPASNTETLWP